MIVDKQMYKQISNLVYGWKIDNREDREDIIQKVAIQMWRTARSPILLPTVVRHAVYDYFRSKQVMNRVTRAVQQHNVVSKEDPEPYIGNVFIKRGKLAPFLREVTRLHYLEEMKQSDIAKRLNIPIGTVKSRISRSISSLRSIISEG